MCAGCEPVLLTARTRMLDGKNIADMAVASGAAAVAAARARLM